MGIQRGAKDVGKRDLWKDWLDRDDRSRLEDLAKESSSSRYLSDLLDSIVTAVHFSGYSRWGTTPSKSSLELLKNEFKEYLAESGEWDELRASWNKDARGPWSLPLFLLRACDRFRSEKHPEMHRSFELGGHVKSGPDTSSALAGIMHDAFVAITHRLPENCKLSYQLHLEGLLNPEIAQLLGLHLGQVEEHIAEAKHFLDGAIVGYGT